MHMTQNTAGFEGAREQNAIASAYPIQLKIEYVSELAAGQIILKSRVPNRPPTPIFRCRQLVTLQIINNARTSNLELWESKNHRIWSSERAEKS